MRGSERLAGIVIAVALSASLFVPAVAFADDNTVPENPPIAVSPQSGAGNQWSAPYQWWRIWLNTGDSVTATLTVTSSGDSCYLRLYPPGTTDGRQSYVAAEGSTWKGFTYTADRTGHFLFRVHTFSYGDSSYVFTFITAAAPVKTAPTLGPPVAPTTMYRTRYYTIAGSLKPRHAAGSYPVRVYKYRRVTRTRWQSYGYTLAKASDYSTYSKYAARIRLPYAGTWRLRAYAPADALHVAAWSGYDYVTVK